MALPVRAVSRPACLAGQKNGKLDANILVTVDGQAGGPDVRLVAPAAKAWRALTAAALAAGHVLKASGPYDSFRPYNVQERIFRARYTTIPNGTTPRYWNGQRWYKRPGVAAAAVPGTSNHGWGLAVDVGEERDGDTGTESIDAGTVGWLVSNAHRFGFSAEIQSEPWHWRYFAGDRVPAEVLDEPEDDLTPEQDRMLRDVHAVLTNPDDPKAILPVVTAARDNTNRLRRMLRLVAAKVGADLGDAEK